MGGKLSSEESSQNHERSGATATAHASGSSTSRNRHSFHQNGSTSRRHGGLYLDPVIFGSEESGQLTDSRFLRARSVVEGMSIPRTAGFRLIYDANDEDDDESDSNDETRRRRRRFMLSQSLPPYISRRMQDSQCPMCKKMIPADDVEVHFVMCLTKPRVSYNEDQLNAAAGECAICLDDMEEGENIARLPCLCIYHKKCIDEWFLTSQTCPEHPPD